jgi:hypothetical protein
MATKPQLSREYLYVPMSQMNFDVDDMDVHQIAFTAEGIEPAELDWIVAFAVGSADPLYQPSIGEALAILVGPTRGDSVTTEDLADGDYQVWVDVAIPTSDERVVRTAGILTVSPTG